MHTYSYSEALEIMAYNFKLKGLVSELIEAQEPTGKFYYIIKPVGFLIDGNFTPLHK